MAKPTKIPTWATGGSAEVVEPPSGKKALGYRAGERPVHGYENWLAKTVGEWLQYLNDGTLDGDHVVDGNIEVTGTTTLTTATANEVTTDALVANTVVQTPSLEATSVAITGGTATALTVNTITLTAEPKHPSYNRTIWITPWSAQYGDGGNSAAADCDANGDTLVLPTNTIYFPIDGFRAGTLQEISWHVTAAAGANYTVRVKSKSGNTVTTQFTASGAFSTGYQLIVNDVSGSAIAASQPLWVEMYITSGNVTFHNLAVAFKQS